MSQILKVAVTGVGLLGSRPTDKYADAAIREVAAKADISADRAGATAQDHSAAACTSLPAVIPATNAISPLVSSSWHYKIAGEFLEAGIHYLRQIYLLESFVTETVGATTDLPQTAIIPHLIDGPVGRLVFTGKLALCDRVNIDNEQVHVENHRFTSLNASDPSLDYQSERPNFMRRGQQQPVQRLTAAIRSNA
jgi:hypothetical protein